MMDEASPRPSSTVGGLLWGSVRLVNRGYISTDIQGRRGY